LGVTIALVGVTLVGGLITSSRGLGGRITARTDFGSNIAEVTRITSVNGYTSRASTEAATICTLCCGTSLAGHRDQIVNEIVKFIPVVGSKNVRLHTIGNVLQLGLRPYGSYTYGKDLQSRNICYRIVHSPVEIGKELILANLFSSFRTSGRTDDEWLALGLSKTVSLKVTTCVFL